MAAIGGIVIKKGGIPMKKTGMAIMVLLMAWGVTACGTGNPAHQSHATIAPSSTNQNIAPLTGLPTTMGTNDRVVMVMINNHTKARPQSGLDKADVVYEILEEGLITRFMAFYQSEAPETVGPVRSIRPYNITLAESFDSIIAHAGGSDQALTTLKESNMPDMDEIYRYNKAYWRISTRKAPHNLYTSIPKLRKGAVAMGYAVKGKVPSFTFHKESDEIKGESGINIEATYSKDYKAEYKYDPNTRQYIRMTTGVLLKDKETGNQVTAANVMVLATPHKIIDQKGHLGIDVEGPGEGYLFQRGVAMKISWELKDGMFRAFKDGIEVPMYPGKTWVNVIPTTPSISDHLNFS